MPHSSHSPWADRLHNAFRVRLALALAATTLALAGVIVAVTAGPANARPKWWSTTTTSTTKAPATATTLAPAPSTTTTVAAAPATTTTVAPAIATTTTTVAPAPTTTTVAPAPAPSTSSGTVLFGGAASDLSALTTFESDAGKKVSLYVSYASWGYDADFPVTAANAVRARGAVPMITWEPWLPGGVSQPNYSLAKIAGGTYDSYISRWASQIKAWGQPLWLRFAHEMNGDWYPWAEGVNGNAAGSYVAAWRHVHDLFAKAGVTNVTWVWSPNVSDASPASLYPGDAYVDWMGVDGYNWGTTASWSAWQTPTEVFGATLANLRRISAKAIVIAETASTEVGGTKSQWVQSFFSMLSQNPDIKAFVWFNFNKETDWRIESSSSARTAFAAGVADPRYKGA